MNTSDRTKSPIEPCAARCGLHQDPTFNPTRAVKRRKLALRDTALPLI
jgi:hypothetical protein